MDKMTTQQLRSIYQQSRNATTKEQALDLAVVSAELGRRGWTLNTDASNWIPPLKIIDTPAAEVYDALRAIRTIVDALKPKAPVVQAVKGAGAWVVERLKKDGFNMRYIVDIDLKDEFKDVDTLTEIRRRVRQANMRTQIVVILPKGLFPDSDDQPTKDNVITLDL